MGNVSKHNLDFNPVGFDGIRKKTDLNNLSQSYRAVLSSLDRTFSHPAEEVTA